MKLILTISLLLLTACSGFERTGYIDPEFIPYVELFEEYKGNSIGNMDIVFEIHKRPKVGVCHYAVEMRTIGIDPTYWKSASPARKENLIFHELGHCDLNLNHTEEYGIMFFSLLGTDFYKEYREDLIEDLFGR
jgi:hypothetical protein